MFWKLFLLVCSANQIHAAQIGESFSQNFLSETQEKNRDACERRISAAIARLEIGQNTQSYGGISYCGTDLTNSFLGRGNATGTGFLVSLDPPILVTNRHNLRQHIGDNTILRNGLENNTNPCNSGQIRFNFTGLGESTGCKRVVYAFHEAYGVDAAFIELDSVPENANFLRLNREPPTGASEVTLAGHPFGSDRINATKCNRYDQGTHDCDSIVGSSGSPLIDENCSVVGLHVGGISDNNCAQEQGSYDAAQRCVPFSTIEDSCRNLTHPSDELQSILSLILTDSIVVRDESQPFDSLQRYIGSQEPVERTTTEPETAIE